MKRRVADDKAPLTDLERARTDRVTVMTRNLCFGTNLNPILAATNQTEFVTAVGNALNQAQATDFPGRASAWAEEIQRAGPDLVGLQEAALIRTGPYDGDPTPHATTVVADLVELLLGELQARGLEYAVVIAQVGQDVEAPGALPTGLAAVRLTHREVILARKEGLGLSNRQRGQYAAAGSAMTFDNKTSIPLPWAWASVDATFNEHTFRFATTHLDPIDGGLQLRQADEFLSGPARTDLPIIWVGDFNSDADAMKITGKPTATSTYQHIIESGFSDAWTAKGAAQPGPTCCQDENLLNPVSALKERVDLILTRGQFRVVDASIVGADPGDRLRSGLWPSDHAGVVATLQL
jgi:endonuclease/exonuclease/phosphatase family metal-dependent hydrolase